MPETSQQSKPPEISPTEHPEEWVLYLQQMLNWFYQMQVVVQDGNFGSQTRGVVEHLRSQLGMSVEPLVDERVWKELEGSGTGTGTGSGEGVGEGAEFSVQLVRGDDETSWAAAIAMVATSNNNTKTLEDVLAASPQRQRTAAEAHQLATDSFGLAAHTCHTGQAESWAGVLRAHHALWVPVPGQDHYVIVVAGIKTEGDAVKVKVLDPHDGQDTWVGFTEFCEAFHFTDGPDVEVLAGA